MASRNGQLLLLDPLPFLCSLPLDLLRRRRVGVVNAANWIGTNFDDLSALAAVHDDGLSHLVAWLLGSRQLGACTVCFRLLDLQLHILIPSQGSALAGIPRRRNLDYLRLGFQSLFHGSVSLGPKTVGRSALCGIKGQLIGFCSVEHLHQRLIRYFLAAVLPGFADLPIRRIPDLTPTAWVAQHSSSQTVKRLGC